MSNKLQMLIYVLWLGILIMLNFLVISAPFMAMKGFANVNKVYDFFIPLCHQYIYRSFCLFKESKNIWFGECIPYNYKKGDIYIETKFTDWKEYRGAFKYNKEEVGRNRADFLIEKGREGYKMPVCARDFGFYLGLLIGSLIYYKIFDKEIRFPLAFFIASAIPIGIDGFIQFFTNYESTIPFRFSTGFVSGIMLGIIIIGNIISKIRK